MDGNNVAKILLSEDNPGDARLVAEEMKDAVADMSFFKLKSECRRPSIYHGNFPSFTVPENPFAFSLDWYIITLWSSAFLSPPS